MGKCRYDLSEDCHSRDCLACTLDKIRDEVGNINDNIILNSDSLYDRKAYVRLVEVLNIIDNTRQKVRASDYGR